MNTATLTAKIEPHSGKLGFVLENSTGKTMLPAPDGYTVAHDLFEHHDLSLLGDLTDEFQAFGTVWYLRGRYGEGRATRELTLDEAFDSGIIADVLKAEILRLASDYRRSIHGMVPEGTLPSDGHAALKAMISYVDAQITAGTRKYHYRALRADYLNFALHHLSIGYNRGAARYPNAIAYNHLFWDVAELVDATMVGVNTVGESYKLVYGINGASPWCAIAKLHTP